MRMPLPVISPVDDLTPSAGSLHTTDLTPEQLDAGIPQQLAGAPLFYVSIGELEII